MQWTVCSVKSSYGGKFRFNFNIRNWTIVTASIVLQLLVGSKLLDLDLSSPEDKSQYQATQKILSIVFTMFEAGVLVLTGSLVPIDNSYLGVLFLQLVIGAIIDNLFLMKLSPNGDLVVVLVYYCSWCL